MSVILIGKATVDEINEYIPDNSTNIVLNGLIHRNFALSYAAIFKQIDISHQSRDKTPQSVLLDWIQSQEQEVTFIIYEFDLFAEQPRQAMLYNILDMAHGSRVNVIGLTRRTDIMEQLEKRVKSRMSHRQINLVGPRTFQDFMDAAKQRLIEIQDNSSLAEPQIETFLKDHQIEAFGRSCFEGLRDLDYFVDTCRTAVDSKSRPDQFLSADVFHKRYVGFIPHKMVSDLSLLELCLLVAAMNVHLINTDVFTFEIIYDAYKEWYGRTESSGSRGLLFKKDVALSAFERLIDLGFLKFIRTPKCPKQFKTVFLTLDQWEIEESVRLRKGNIPDTLVRWAGVA